MRLVYLASPYSKYVHGHFWAYDQACRAAARLMEARINVFAPIVYGHTLAQRMPEMPHEFWLNFCLPYMKSSESCAILVLDGWRDSVGVMSEVAWFKERKRPITYISMGDLELSDELLNKIVFWWECPSMKVQVL